MLQTFRAEMFKLVRRPAIWILASVFLVLAQVFGYLFPYIAYRAGGGSGFGAGQTAAQLLADILPARLVPNTMSGFPMFAGAIALVIGGLVAGSEYGWGTLKTILTQRSGRLAVIGGKLLAVVVTTTALVATVFALDGVWSWVIASVESRPADWPAIGELARGVGAGSLIIGTWGLVGAALGIVLRSTSLAIGLGLVWALVIENLVRGFAGMLGFLDAFQKALPGVNAGSLAASFGAEVQGQPGGTPGVTAVASGTQAALVLIVYVIALVLIAAVTFRRQDVA